MARTHVILPDELLEEIDALVGKRKRSEFIAETLGKELKRRRLIEATRLAAGSLRDADTPPEWETSEGAAAWVRAIRQWPDHWEEAADESTNNENSAL